MQPLLARGYDKTLVIGTVTGSSLGLIIPPSIGFIVYGFLTDTSVGELFMAGGRPRSDAGRPVQRLRGHRLQGDRQVPSRSTTPGLTGSPRCASRSSSSWGRYSSWAASTPGWPPPTEAGAILVLYSLLCALIYRKIDLKGFIQSIIDSSVLSTMILISWSGP